MERRGGQREIQGQPLGAGADHGTPEGGFGGGQPTEVVKPPSQYDKKTLKCENSLWTSSDARDII